MAPAVKAAVLAWLKSEAEAGPTSGRIADWRR
ncbi:hypothetical protein MUDAN_DOGOELCO_01744 [Lactiplantibacillus mudanjiangensis]|nr:hypothetical protein MUDAN_DOGOELCO_01744 [Lactiplantibacillus mudanjiangensis]